MIKGIFKQMWAQRSSNGWLLIELIIVFVVVWLVIDPLYVLQYQRAIPMGFDYENIYKIDVKMLPNTAFGYSKEDEVHQKLMEDLKRMGNTIKTYQGVEAVAIHDRGHPFGFSSSFTPGICAEGDTLAERISVQQMTYLRGWDYWEVYRFTSVTDNKWETIAEIELPANGVIITKDMDAKLFEKLSKENSSYRKSIRYSDMGNEPSIPVVGVINYVKRNPSSQPNPILFEAVDNIDAETMKWGVVISIRVRDGIAGNKFIQEFKKDMSPKLKIGNLRMVNITSFSQARNYFERMYGIANTVRTQQILAIFFLMVIFLGVISSFWLKTETRRGEVGLRMALGASRGKIIRRFVMEGWVLVLVSSVIGLMIQLNIVYFQGLSRQSRDLIPEAWPINNSIAHFTIVTLIVFALLMLTVTIGSLFPASKASKINPVDALRDE